MDQRNSLSRPTNPIIFFISARQGDVSSPVEPCHGSSSDTTANKINTYYLIG